MMKVMFVFSLLHRGSIRADAVNEYVRRVPCYADLDARFVGHGLATLGETLAAELLAAGAVRLADGAFIPTMAA